MSSSQKIWFAVVFFVTSFVTLYVSAETERRIPNIDLNEDAESGKLLEPSVLDILLRKKREGCDNTVTEKVEGFYEKVEEVPVAGNDTEISVEQAEIVAYDEIVTAGQEEYGTNTSPVADYLTPPADNANCTTYTEDHEEIKSDTAKSTEKTAAADAASGTIIAF